jgi:multiple sugar transport system permease protein
MRLRRTPASVALIYLGYALVLAIFLLPVLWICSLSLRPLDEMFAFPPKLIPSHPDLGAYRAVLIRSPFLIYVWNSVKFAAATVAGGLLLGLPAAYALSRLRFRRGIGRQGTMLAILGIQLISPLVTILPLYRYFSAAGLINSQPAVALVYIAFQAPLAAWMLKGYCDAIPVALDEAARIDGCSRLQALRRVLVPVMLPGIAATAIVLAVNSWGQFLIPYILLDKPGMLPIGVGILDFQSTTDAVSTNQLAAAAVLAALPALLIFLVLQRFIIGAMTAGAVKG